MAVKVLIPTPLQKFTRDQAAIECNGANITDLLNSLDQDFPGIKARLCDDQGELRRFINFYVNSEDIRFWTAKTLRFKKEMRSALYLLWQGADFKTD